MRKTSLLLAALIVVAAAWPFLTLHAGNSTLTYTAGQSTAIQNQLIPRYNAEHCTQFGLLPTCSSAELVTAGCVPRVIKSLNMESCTIFPSSVGGEQAFLQEVANNGLVSVFNRLISNDNQAYIAAECARFRGLSAGAQATECTTRGLPSTCAGPCP